MTQEQEAMATWGGAGFPGSQAIANRECLQQVMAQIRNIASGQVLGRPRSAYRLPIRNGA